MIMMMIKKDSVDAEADNFNDNDDRNRSTTIPEKFATKLEPNTL